MDKLSTGYAQAVYKLYTSYPQNGFFAYVKRHAGRHENRLNFFGEFQQSKNWFWRIKTRQKTRRTRPEKSPPMSYFLTI